jgi:hypothetical protein
MRKQGFLGIHELNVFISNISETFAFPWSLVTKFWVLSYNETSPFSTRSFTLILRFVVLQSMQLTKVLLIKRHRILKLNKYYCLAHLELGQLSWYSDRIWAGWPGFVPWAEERDFSAQHPGRTQLLPSAYERPFPWDIEQREYEAYHSPSSSVEVKNGGAKP